MIENLFATLQLLLALVVGASPDASAGALALAIAVVALVALVSAAAMSPEDARSGAHPRRAIDLSTLVFQCDPDAAGHPRPRAPGSAASAA